MLEDQGIDTSTDPWLLHAEAEKILKEQYLAKFPVSAPAVHLESKNFVNQLAFTMLIIPVPQECIRRANSVLSLLRRLSMSFLVIWLLSCSWSCRRIIWS
jgi:hypothetical protein